MAFSLFVDQGIIDTPYLISKYWTHKFDEDHILITTEHGAWITLDGSEYYLFRTHNISKDLNLFKNLEEKGIIVTENNIEKLVYMYRDRFHHLFNGTSLHLVVPTLRCNHKCLYCYASSKPIDAKEYDMDKPTAKKVVDFIFQTPSNFITLEFQGGEPLLNFPIIEFIVEYVKKKNKTKGWDKEGWMSGEKTIVMQIVTNLSAMDDDILNYLIKNNIRICTSLDGPKKLHNKNRHFYKGSSYEKVIFWIERMKKERKYKYFTGALPTVTRYSLPFVDEIVDEYIKHNILSIRMRHLMVSGLAKNIWNKIGYSAEVFSEFWKKYFEYVISMNKKGIEFIDTDAINMLRRIITLVPPNNACLGAPCGACTIQSSYNQWGDIYTCDEARSNELFKLGNVKKNSYKDIYTSPNALNFVGLTSMLSSFCDNCEWHPYCSPCLINSFGEQGNIISKVPFDFTCKIRRSQTEHIFRKLLFSSDKNILLKWLSKSYF